MRRFAVKRILLAVLIFGIVSVGSQNDVTAQQSVREDSLKFIPADATVYTSNLQIKRQWNALVQSRAMKKVFESPFVQMGVGQLRGMWDGMLQGEMQEFWQQPINQQLLSLGKQAISNEIFFYMDERSVDFMREFVGITQAINGLQIQAVTSGGTLDEDDFGEIFRSAVKSVPNLVPNLVIGFRIEDRAAALAQLDRLDALVKMGFENEKELAPYRDQYKELKTPRARHLTLEIDGELIPWDRMLEDSPFEEDQQAELIESLRALELAISVGLLDDYVLIGIGQDLEQIKKLENPGELLIDHEELRPVRDSNVDLVSVSYTSDKVMNAVPPSQQFGFFATAFLQGIKSQAPESLHSDLEQDFAMIQKDLTSWIPTPGSVLRFVYLTDHGYEGKLYNRSENRWLDGSKPLEVTKHLGGDPVFFYAARGKPSKPGDSVLARYAKRIAHYIEAVAEMEQDDADAQAFLEFFKETKPLLARIGNSYLTKVAPSFGTEAAFVIDAQATAKSWHPALPPSDEPLPMLELGYVMSITDADQLKAGCSEIYGTLREIQQMARQAQPDAEIPELPAPEVKSVGDATMYGYALPEESGLDSQLVMPHALLSDDLLVLAVLPATSQRLMQPRAIQQDGVLARLDRPAMSAVQFRWPGLVDAIISWVNYGAKQNEDGRTAMIVGQAQLVGEILSCFRGYSSVTFDEANAIVTHFEWHFEDLP